MYTSEACVALYAMPRRNYRRHNAHRIRCEMDWLFDSRERIDTPRQGPGPVPGTLELTRVPDVYDVVARFSSNSARVGWCLIVNPVRGTVAIRKYSKGCSTCAPSSCWASNWDEHDPFHDAVPMSVMLRRAETLDDPSLPGRPMLPDDHGFSAVQAMYVQFTMLCVEASAWPTDLVHVVWMSSPWYSERHVWSETRYRALVRLQACVRGYLFRKYVLWSPHTDIGHRFLTTRFERELADNERID